MPYIQLYEDAACTQLYAALPTVPYTFQEIRTQPHDVTIDGKTYKMIGHADNSLMISVDLMQSNPPFLTSRNRFPDGKTFYCKNGFRFTITEKSTETYDTGTVSHVYVNNFNFNNGYTTTQTYPLSLYCIQTIIDGKLYYGFTAFYKNQQNYDAYAVILAQDDFWSSTFRPPYDYSAGSDEDGGQGTGAIPGQNATDSSTPSRIIPTGGRGLHTYLINITAYGDIQGYLWGDNSTLAKSLWQKFLNKTHSPISCVLGCYSLPGVFMPSATGNTGVHLAGMYLTPIGGTCSSVDLGFVDHEITFSPLDAPFHSFADYTCIACKLHLPIVGDISIPAEFIVNRTITVRYRVDQMNGNTVARVKSDGQVIAELSGNCAYNLPITGGDDGTLDRLGALANTTLQLSQGNVAGAMAQSAAGLGAQFQTSVVNSSMNGNSTACQNGIAYIEYIYPTTNYPSQYGQVYGYACSISGVLTDFNGGYGEFEVNIDSMEIAGATLEEKEEIRQLLREGIMVC